MNAPIDTYTLIAQHRVAFKAWCDTSDEDWDTPAALEAGDLMDAAHDALFNHRPATLQEAREKAAYMASCRSFLEWDSIEKIKLIEALTPAPTDHAAIDALIEAHKASWAALDAACQVTDQAFGTADEAAAEEAQGEASDATAAAIGQIIEHPYSSIEELQHGVAYLLEHHRTTGDGDPAAWFTSFAEHLVGGRTNG
jgi:hypothetical protein